MDFSSFLTSLGTSFLIFVILMLLFTWLARKPSNSVIYYPNRILKGMDPLEGGKRTRNPFAWIREALSSSEDDVISMSGVDSAVYFVFLSTGLSSFLCFSVIFPIWRILNHSSFFFEGFFLSLLWWFWSSILLLFLDVSLNCCLLFLFLFFFFLASPVSFGIHLSIKAICF